MFIKIPITYDTEDIKNYLVGDHGFWDEHNKRRTFQGSPHSEMTDIWVRFGDVSHGDYSKLSCEHDSVWYPCADIIPDAKNIAFDLMRAVDGERLGGVLITKLPPGGKIAPHIDSGWHAEYYDKFYIALSNSPGSSFCFENGIIDAVDGECFWFRNDVLHWVENNSCVDRLAMIVCIKTDMFKGAK
jgi:hypothetical protein